MQPRVMQYVNEKVVQVNTPAFVSMHMKCTTWWKHVHSICSVSLRLLLSASLRIISGQTYWENDRNVINILSASATQFLPICCQVTSENNQFFMFSITEF